MLYSDMKTESYRNIVEANKCLEEAQTKVICLTESDIPPLRRQMIIQSLENIILNYRNFFPGDYKYTVNLFYTCVEPDNEILRSSEGSRSLLFAYQNKSRIRQFSGTQDHPQPDLWEAARIKRAQDLLEQYGPLPIIMHPQVIPSKIKINADYTFINLGAAQPQVETDEIAGRLAAISRRLNTIMEKCTSQVQALHTECTKEIELIQEQMANMRDLQ